MPRALYARGIIGIGEEGMDAFTNLVALFFYGDHLPVWFAFALKALYLLIDLFE